MATKKHRAALLLLLFASCTYSHKSQGLKFQVVNSRNLLLLPLNVQDFKIDRDIRPHLFRELNKHREQNTNRTPYR